MSICVECAAWKRDCCHATHEDKISNRFSLTLADAQRIAKVLEVPVADFACVVPTDRDFASEVEKFYPGSGRMFAHDQRLILRFDGERGACQLLGAKGCKLSLYDRPRFCSLYPSWYAVDGESIEISPFAFGNNCLACQTARRLMLDPLALIGMRTTLHLFARASNTELKLHAKTPLESIKRLCAL